MYSLQVPWPEPERLAALVGHHANALWLDSALDSHPLSQQSIVVLDTLKQWAWDPTLNLPAQQSFWRNLHELMAPRASAATWSGFCGGVIGFLTYEGWGGHEKFSLPRKEMPLPSGKFALVDTALVLDHLNKEAKIFSWGLHPEKLHTNSAIAKDRCEAFEQALATAPPLPELDVSQIAFSPVGDKDSYLENIDTIQEAIRRGDYYQVNFCQKFQVGPIRSPAAFYLKWRQVAPAPQMALWNVGEHFILCASPEVLLSGKGSQVTSLPIKGTRPRHPNPERDAGLAQELLHSEKDRAELLMIVDLVRNDLGQVCRSGTIQVPELWQLTSYSQVHHLYAKIQGELAEGHDALDALLALFPGGSITGAPKLKAMEAIQDLEAFARGIFTGSLGYFSWNGSFQWNIAIRSGLWHQGSLDYFSGGGIVVDSDPELEYEECLVKAEGLLQALK